MIIKVKAYLSSGREEIVKINEEEYKIYIKKPAEDNKANIEILKLLKKYFKKEARILRGMRSRDKIIEIKDN